MLLSPKVAIAAPKSFTCKPSVFTVASTPVLRAEFRSVQVMSPEPTVLLSSPIACRMLLTPLNPATSVAVSDVVVSVKSALPICAPSAAILIAPNA